MTGQKEVNRYGLTQKKITAIQLIHSATADKMFRIIIIIKAADSNTMRSRCMNKIIIHQVKAYVRNGTMVATIVCVKKNKVTLFQFIFINMFGCFVLFHCGAWYYQPIHCQEQSAGKCAAVNA